MYPDDSIMCCLFPNKCNMFPQTPAVIFSNTLGYLNMIIILTSPVFIVWSLMQIVLQFVEGKNNKLIDNDAKDNFEERSHQKEEKSEKSESTDYDCFSNDDYDADADKTCSDSKVTLGLQHESNIDKSISNINALEKLVKNINMTNTSRSSNISCERDNTSSSEDCRHKFAIVASHTSSTTNGRSLTIISNNCDDQEESLMKVVRLSTVDDKPKDTLPVKDMDSTDQHQNKPSSRRS